jgi:hypothetical protein
MPECLYCPICELDATGILHKKSYATYCSKHLLETIKKMKFQIINQRRIYKRKGIVYMMSDELADISNEIRRRYYR